MATNKELIIEMIRYSIPVIGTIGGTFLGGWFTGRSQEKLFLRQRQLDIEKELRNDKRLALVTYNKILKLDGECMIIEFNGGHTSEFNHKEYNERIRPIIFEYFHLVDKKIADIVLDIDEKLRMCDFYEEITNEDHEYLCMKYNYLTHTIKHLLNLFRESIIGNDK